MIRLVFILLIGFASAPSAHAAEACSYFGRGESFIGEESPRAFVGSANCSSQNVPLIIVLAHLEAGADRRQIRSLLKAYISRSTVNHDEMRIMKQSASGDSFVVESRKGTEVTSHFAFTFRSRTGQKYLALYSDEPAAIFNISGKLKNLQRQMALDRGVLDLE